MIFFLSSFPTSTNRVGSLKSTSMCTYSSYFGHESIWHPGNTFLSSPPLVPIRLNFDFGTNPFGRVCILIWNPRALFVIRASQAKQEVFGRGGEQGIRPHVTRNRDTIIGALWEIVRRARSRGPSWDEQSTGRVPARLASKAALLHVSLGTSVDPARDISTAAGTTSQRPPHVPHWGLLGMSFGRIVRNRP